MEISKATMKKIFAIILFGGAVYFLIRYFESLGSMVRFIWGIITPFVVGAVMAFILNIPMNFFERKVFKKWMGKKIVRPASLIVTLLLVALVVLGVVAVVLPQLGNAVVELVTTANKFIPKFKVWADDFFENNEVIRSYIDSFNINPSQIMSTIVEFIKNGAGGAFGNVLTAAQAVASGVTGAVIGIVFACYLLMQKEKVLRQIKMLRNAILPKKAAEKATYIVSKCTGTFAHFISGQCLEACILGLMYFIILMPIRMPYALLISVLMAFMALIPVIGVFIGGVVCAFIVFMESPIMALIFIIVFVIVQNVEGNFIYPKVVGGSIGLPSMWVIVAVTIGSSLMGIVGMLFFIPLTSVIYSLVKEWTYKRLEEEKDSAEAPEITELDE